MALTDYSFGLQSKDKPLTLTLIVGLIVTLILYYYQTGKKKYWPFAKHTYEMHV